MTDFELMGLALEEAGKAAALGEGYWMGLFLSFSS